MRKKTGWETDDGVFFDTLDEAKYHEKMHALRDYIDDHPFDSTGIDVITGQDVIDYIKCHPRLHLMLLPEIEEKETED